MPREDTMDELRRIAAIAVEDPPITRTPLDELERRASRRVGRRRLSIAAVALAALLIGGGALARAGTSDTEVATQPAPTLPAHQQGDLVIYMQADATAAEIGAVRDQLLADADVTHVRFATQADSLDDFRCLFADQQELVDNVAPDILPSSFRIEILDGAAGAGAVTERYRDEPGVLSVISPSDAANGLAPSGPGVTTGDEPSPIFTSDCPLVGTVLE